jgi:hypothetical protein
MEAAVLFGAGRFACQGTSSAFVAVQLGEEADAIFSKGLRSLGNRGRREKRMRTFRNRERLVRARVFTGRQKAFL